MALDDGTGPLNILLVEDDEHDRVAFCRALEKSEIEVKTYYSFYDRFTTMLLLAIGLFFFEVLLRSTIYRKVP